MRARWIAATAAVGIVFALGRVGSSADWAVKVEPMSSPAPAGSSSPQLTTQGDRAIVSWLERSGSQASLKFAERTSSGWSAPRTVVSGTNLIVNASDVPSVRALADKTLVASWLQSNGPDPEAYDLRISQSKDGGMTWSPASSPHHDGTKTEHGFASFFDLADGGWGLVWLDGRATDPAKPNATDNMSLRASSYGANGKQLREVPVDNRVCECCPTSAAQTSDGPIVAFRNRSEREVRDIYVTRLVGGQWSRPTPVHNDNWMIEACPVNGPAIGARDRNVAVAWFAAPKDEGRAFVAFSKDAGRTFGPPVRVDEAGSTGHVGIAMMKGGSAIVAWVEFANNRSQFRIRRVDGAGRSPSVTVAGTGEGRVAGIPRIATVRDELLFVWTETNAGASQVRTARGSIGAATAGH